MATATDSETPERPQDDQPESKRVSVTLRRTDRDRLDQIIDETKLPTNDAIRHALATEAFILRAMREGSKILIETSDGRTREVEFVY